MAIITLNNNSLVNADVGKVLQVVQTVNTAATTISVATATLSSNIMSVNITPSSTSSKIYLIANFGCLDTTTICTNIILNADGTDIHIGDASGSRSRASSRVYNTDERTSSGGGISSSFLHSPSSTSQITYGVKLSHSSGSTQSIYINTHQGDTDVAKVSRYSSSLIAMEIAG
jgi:hypothetical protein